MWKERIRHEGKREKFEQIESALRSALTYIEPAGTDALVAIPVRSSFSGQHYDLMHFSGRGSAPVAFRDFVESASIARTKEEMNIAKVPVFLSVENPGERRRLRLVNDDLSPRLVDRGVYGSSQIELEY